ncbi:MAG: hypothetical protein HC881_07925 [Leptolyngbyaceae cyanobacterium SL_7_1]|nr:hypothetical protein [Leptolyngbyaceae cyanobacterium SL_7_1]
MNNHCFLVRVIALLTPWVGMATPIHAQEAIAPPSRGICAMQYYSGLATIDTDGQVVSLEDYCRAFPSVAPETAPISVEGNKFWQAFLTAASPAALAFAESTGQQAVIDYGMTICPYLDDGGSLPELRQIQSSLPIPPSFDVAVTVAAIHTNCPEYRAGIGRRE